MLSTFFERLVSLDPDARDVFTSVFVPTVRTGVKSFEVVVLGDRVRSIVLVRETVVPDDELDALAGV